MKKFFISFLGALTAIWVSVLLLGIATFVTVLIMLVSTFGGEKQADIKKNSVICLDMGMSVDEYAQSTSLLSRLYSRDFEDHVALSEIVEAIDRASTDKNIAGMYIKCDDEISAGLTQLRAISDAVARFRKAGKWVMAYGDTMSQGDYIVAAEADSLFINPEGMIEIHGLASQGMYYKDAMDKFGVEMQVVKVGTYKSAVEPYILNAPSEPAREQTMLFMTNMWNNITERIAKLRGVDAKAVNCWADSLCAFKQSSYYKSEKIVDGIAYRHEFMEKIKNKVGVKKIEDINFVSPQEYYATGRNMPETGKTKIAVYYAEGEIVDDGESGIVGNTVVKDILKLAEDDDISGLVLRVNSPGGSAFASEQIWEALEQFKKITGKPFYVSMGDYAASGGYYISCGADKIYADPLTLTGSIGIFGMIPNISGLTKGKIGVNMVTTATNPQGQTPSMWAPMTEFQRQSLQAYVDRGYETFVGRVAKGRKMTVDQVKTIAEGRVWDGQEALKIKLVDKLGDLDAAVKDMAAALKVEKFKVVKYPEVEADVWGGLFELGKTIKAHILGEELGEAADIYNNLKSLQNMAPVQARMEYVTIR